MQVLIACALSPFFLDDGQYFTDLSELCVHIFRHLVQARLDVVHTGDEGTRVKLVVFAIAVAVTTAGTITAIAAAVAGRYAVAVAVTDAAIAVAGGTTAGAVASGTCALAGAAIAVALADRAIGAEGTFTAVAMANAITSPLPDIYLRPVDFSRHT
jgi:hypothetical protein